MSEQMSQNVHSVLQLITQSAGKDKKGQERILLRTLNLPQKGPEVIQKIEMIDAIRETLPSSMHDVTDEIKENLMLALISTSSYRGGFMTLLTTQKSEFKINNPQMRKNIVQNLIRGSGNDE